MKQEMVTSHVLILKTRNQAHLSAQAELFLTCLDQQYMHH